MLVFLAFLVLPLIDTIHILTSVKKKKFGKNPPSPFPPRATKLSPLQIIMKAAPPPPSLMKLSSILHHCVMHLPYFLGYNFLSLFSSAGFLTSQSDTMEADYTQTRYKISVWVWRSSSVFLFFNVCTTCCVSRLLRSGIVTTRMSVQRTRTVFQHFRHIMIQ